MFPENLTRASRLGATLYMPAVNPRAAALLEGQPEASAFGAGSVVVCLEDALGETDISRALSIVKEALAVRAARGEALLPNRPMVFVRPRGFDMAQRIAAMPGMSQIDGMVLPKVTIRNASSWFGFARETGVAIMPTLESVDFFAPAAVSEMGAVLAQEGGAHVLCVRIGGNDLLSCLGLRRLRGRTSHEGPLAWIMGSISGQLMAQGFSVSAPVYDVFGDLATLAREVERDVEMGFVGKTAIHPDQIPIIHAALQVTAEELLVAEATLAKDAAAVFQVDGLMCEPATHRRWAQRILARAEAWGIRNDPAFLNSSTLDPGLMSSKG